MEFQQDDYSSKDDVTEIDFVYKRFNVMVKYRKFGACDDSCGITIILKLKYKYEYMNREMNDSKPITSWSGPGNRRLWISFIVNHCIMIYYTMILSLYLELIISD